MNFHNKIHLATFLCMVTNSIYRLGKKTPCQTFCDSVILLTDFENSFHC